MVFATAANIGLGTNNHKQVYLISRDPLNGSLTRTIVSVNNDTGMRATSDCFFPSVSDDGKFVAFETTAALVGGDTNNITDIYMRDLSVNPAVTRRVSIASSGDPNLNGISYSGVVSGDGFLVAFTSNATNLLGDLNLSEADVYVARTNGIADVTYPQRVSVDNSIPPQQHTNAGTTNGLGQGAAPGRVINSDGTLVLFHASPCNWDDSIQCSTAGVNCLCSRPDNACAAGCFLLGACVAPCTATGNVPQVYLRDLTSQHTYRVSRFWDAGLAYPSDSPVETASLSSDGSRIAFVLSASQGGVTYKLVFVLKTDDIDEAGVQPLDVTSAANGDSKSPMLSPAGNEIAFSSAASNLVSGDSNGKADVFVFDIGSGTVGQKRRYSVASSGAQATGGDSVTPDVGGEGKVIVYASKATNLVTGDTNGVQDIFETMSGGKFKRGDARGDGAFNATADADFLNQFLFSGGPAPPCLDAADATDDGVLNVTDVVRIGQSGPFPTPGSTTCGNEPASSGEGLTCAVHACP